MFTLVHPRVMSEFLIIPVDPSLFIPRMLVAKLYICFKLSFDGVFLIKNRIVYHPVFYFSTAFLFPRLYWSLSYINLSEIVVLVNSFEIFESYWSVIG